MYFRVRKSFFHEVFNCNYTKSTNPMHFRVCGAHLVRLSTATTRSARFDSESLPESATRLGTRGLLTRAYPTGTFPRDPRPGSAEGLSGDLLKSTRPKSNKWHRSPRSPSTLAHRARTRKRIGNRLSCNLVGQDSRDLASLYKG